MSSKNQQNHIVYGLSFKQSDIPDDQKSAFLKELNQIRIYGSSLPTDDQIIFYVGESKRASERHKEHIYHSYSTSSIEYEYNSRQFIRMLDHFNVEWSMTTLKEFPIGGTTNEFEDYFVCMLASENHPLTNMVAGLTQPNVEELGRCNSVEQYTKLKKEIKARNKPQRTYKQHYKRQLMWNEAHKPSRSEQLQINDRVSAHLILKTDQMKSSDKKLQLSMIAFEPDDYLWNSKKLFCKDVSIDHLKNLIIQAANNKLDKPKKIDPTANMSPSQMLKLYGG